MKYTQDFSTQLNDLDGTPIVLGLDPQFGQVLAGFISALPKDQATELVKRSNEIFGKPATLGGICVAALLAPFEDEKGLPDRERMTRYELARRINKAGTQEFSAEDRDLMKKLVGKRYLGSLLAPTVWELLEGATKKE
jgi:hypothetical protein